MGKAAVNAPHSKRFARCEDARWPRQRLECGGFSTAFRTFRHPNAAGETGGRSGVSAERRKLCGNSDGGFLPKAATPMADTPHPKLRMGNELFS